MSNAIPQPPRRLLTRVAIPGSLVAIALGVLGWTAWRTLAPLPSVDVVPVTVRGAAPVATGGTAAPTEGAPVQAPGWVEPSPFPVLVPALTPGIVRTVGALEGDPVAKDQVLVELVDDEQRIALRSAESVVLESRAKVAEMEDELGRKSRLVEGGAASAGEVARLRLRIDAMRAATEAAEAERAMRALALERTRIRAPIDGVVMVRGAVPGMAAGSMGDGKPLFELYDPSRLQVRADVPLADAGRIAAGDRAEIVLDVLPGRTFRGEVIRMVHQADIAKNTVQAKVRIDDPAAELKPEMLARVRIVPRTGGGRGGEQGGGSGGPRASKDALWVQDRCIARGSEGASVLLVAALDQGRGVVERRAVEIAGASVDGWTEVRSGLRAGDLAIADPASAPSPGSRVRIEEKWRTTEGADHGSH